VKRSKKQKLADAHLVYTAAKQGTRPKRGAKDGSIPTHPVVPCPDLSELGKGGVQDLCYKWLKARRIMCDCHACSRKGGVLYGIKDSGDIHGILPDGRHFELECKRGRGGRLKKGQQERMVDVRHTAGLYFVVHGIPELEHYFKGIL
jgi:hypothetical protein